MCPVMTDEAVDPLIVEQYGDVKIGFCCELCWSKFTKDPEPYLANLPAEAKVAVRAAQAGPADAETQSEAEPATASESGESRPIDLSEHLDLVALVVLLLLALLLGLRKSAASRRAAVVLVLIGLAGVAGVSWWRAQTARVELDAAERELERNRWKELIHNNTYYDFGTPPRPQRPPVKPRLQATFYRGNDERSDELFNGGDYLTSYLDLSLVDVDGQAIAHGDDVSGRDLWLRFQIRRGPNTPDFFWGDDIMGEIFLTANGDPFLGSDVPLTDRNDLVTLEPMARWEALYPLGRVSGQGEERLEEVVYVADAWEEKGQMIGATFHYGIEVALDLTDGVVSEESEVYLGALFRPRKSPYSRVPPEEWLSHEPIPELPAPQGDDPETLGIVDYLDGGEPGK